MKAETTTNNLSRVCWSFNAVAVRDPFPPSSKKGSVDWSAVGQKTFSGLWLERVNEQRFVKKKRKEIAAEEEVVLHLRMQFLDTMNHLHLLPIPAHSHQGMKFLPLTLSPLPPKCRESCGF